MEKRAKSVDAAIELALSELKITREQADIKIIAEGSKGFLGFGAKDAVVEVTKKKASNSAPRTKAKPSPTPVVKEQPVPVQTSKKAEKRVSELPADKEAEKFLDDLFKAMGLNVEIESQLAGENELSIKLSSDNMGIIIGKRGDTLDSLQYLTSLVVNRTSDDYIKVSIDTAQNYREKRAQTLKELAQSKAQRVLKTGRKFTLEPMNPYERRIIHAYLQDNNEITTYSIGQEPYRKVVIAPKNKPHYTSHKKHDYNKSDVSVPAEVAQDASSDAGEPIAEKKGSYTTTYKADFKPAQHKAQFASFEDYLAAQNKED